MHNELLRIFHPSPISISIYYLKYLEGAPGYGGKILKTMTIIFQFNSLNKIFHKLSLMKFPFKLTFEGGETIEPCY